MPHLNLTWLVLLWYYFSPSFLHLMFETGCRKGFFGSWPSFILSTRLGIEGTLFLGSCCLIVTRRNLILLAMPKLYIQKCLLFVLCGVVRLNTIFSSLYEVLWIDELFICTLRSDWELAACDWSDYGQDVHRGIKSCDSQILESHQRPVSGHAKSSLSYNSSTIDWSTNVSPCLLKCLKTSNCSFELLYCWDSR